MVMGFPEKVDSKRPMGVEPKAGEELSMAKKRYIKHSQEIRDEAVRLVLEGEESITGTAKKLGIGYTTVYGWVMDARKERGDIRDEAESAADELKRLRRENQRLRMEQEILKKAMAFFAKENQ
jgi:transposase